MGHEVSDETRAKIGERSRGRIASDETRAKLSAGQTRHSECVGGVRTPEYRAWDAMRQRCLNPKAVSYQRYGAVGITVCDRWASFENFLADMGRRPSSGHSLDRIDGTRGYAPGNCRWATVSEQNRNRPNFQPDKRSKR